MQTLSTPATSTPCQAPGAADCVDPPPPGSWSGVASLAEAEDVFLPPVADILPPRRRPDAPPATEQALDLHPPRCAESCGDGALRLGRALAHGVGSLYRLPQRLFDAACALGCSAVLMPLFCCHHLMARDAPPSRARV